MKNSLLLLMITAFFSCKNYSQEITVSTTNIVDINKNNQNKMEKQTIYQFKVKDLSGKEFDFASLKGKKILIVNTASKCGLTPQYKDLEAIYEKYKSKDFVIIGFPANNFGKQEPGTDKEIQGFCEMNYGVTFPMMSKISVKGSDMNEVYQFLTQKSKNGFQDSDVEWNFQKYLIGADGELEKVVKPQVLPTDELIVGWINK